MDSEIYTVCSWCQRPRLSEFRLGAGTSTAEGFCSEKCFALSRRAEFKRGKIRCKLEAVVEEAGCPNRGSGTSSSMIVDDEASLSRGENSSSYYSPCTGGSQSSSSSSGKREVGRKRVLCSTNGRRPTSRTSSGGSSAAYYAEQMASNNRYMWLSQLMANGGMTPVFQPPPPPPPPAPPPPGPTMPLYVPLPVPIPIPIFKSAPEILDILRRYGYQASKRPPRFGTNASSGDGAGTKQLQPQRVPSRNCSDVQTAALDLRTTRQPSSSSSSSSSSSPPTGPPISTVSGGGSGNYMSRRKHILDVSPSSLGKTTQQQQNHFVDRYLTNLRLERYQKTRRRNKLTK